jgi:molybdopterin synthase sulfur carrier subunit
MRILYFAWLREKIGFSEENLELPAAVATVGALIDWLKTRDARHAAAFAKENRIRCAIDQEIAGHDASLAGAAEIAFFPPVTGG